MRDLLARDAAGGGRGAGMKPAARPERRSRRLLAVAADGGLRHLLPANLASLLRPGDLVVANDAATLPASLQGRHAG